MIRGSKGSDVFASTGDPRVDLSIRVVRGATDLRTHLHAVVERDLTDAATMTFHSRNIRGGKGERAIFQTLFLALHEKHPELCRSLLPLVPHYGSWRDLFALMQACDPLAKTVLEIVVRQLKADTATEEGKSISLCAKWAPREGQPGAKEIGAALFPDVPTFSTRMRLYRKYLSALNRRLKTVEIDMCGGSWAAIKPDAVPGRAGKLYAKAFLNTKKGGGLRHPDNEDRMACRAHFQEHLDRVRAGTAKLHGATTVFPHEVIREALISSKEDEDRERLSLLWKSIVESVRAGGGLARSVFMSDFSGSMQSAGSVGDTPYLVSMAMGILGAQITIGRFLTFDSTPKWHALPDSDIFACTSSILKSGVGQGTSTDFQAAMELILADIKGRRVRPGEEPENLIVLTDMNWDQACGSHETSYYTGNSYRHHVKHKSWETHIEMIRESFKRAGEDMWGVPFQMPRIVIWNLAANPTDFHAEANTPGVIHLSGWSPTQFKILQKEGVRPVTPLESLRVELDDPQYDRVREIVSRYRPFEGHADGWGAVTPGDESLRP